MSDRKRFALDQNFPVPIVAALSEYMGHLATFTSVRDIDKSFAETDDWELLHKLANHEGKWSGLITNDGSMVSLAREMAIVKSTGLMLIIARGQGSNPVKSTGVLFAHIGRICNDKGQSGKTIWNLGVGAAKPTSPEHYLGKIARHAKMTYAEIYAREMAAAEIILRDAASPR